VVLGLATSIFAGPLTEPVAAQEELIQRGNQLYQESDFTGALEAYLAVLEAGFEGADLYYNLGNAYFKTGDLGNSILTYERALRLRPRDPDVQANLELARSLTADEIEPLPRFWVFSVLSWWVNFLPRAGLIALVTVAYLLGAAGLCLRILSPRARLASWGTWVAGGAAVVLIVFGTTLLARQGILGGTEWGIVMAEEVAVQSAPSNEDDLTLFRVHEGTKVRIDQDTETWSEIVLEDGRVGWVPADVLETI
jgi:tetratricopeptide (TPR) repeat protein